MIVDNASQLMLDDMIVYLTAYREVHGNIPMMSADSEWGICGGLLPDVGIIHDVYGYKDFVGSRRLEDFRVVSNRAAAERVGWRSMWDELTPDLQQSWGSLENYMDAFDTRIKEINTILALYETEPKVVCI